MNIAWDARKLFDGGIGTYIRGVLGALSAAPSRAAYTALVNRADAGRVSWPGAVAERLVRARKYGLAEHWVVPRAARAAQADLLHAPHYTLPLGWSGPAIVTIHDLIHLRFPRHFAPGASAYASAVAGSGARRARLVVADSVAGREEILERLGVAATKVRVVPLGVSPAFTPATAEAIAVLRSARRLPADYVLYVGARKRHKNIELLLRAWAAMPAAARPPLLLSGPPWAPSGPLAQLAQSLGVTSCLGFAGVPADDAELAVLYSGALLLVQPSLWEGFGLPPLEAMACGTPVVSSFAGALPEVVGDAAVLLSPHDVERWAETIPSLLGDADCRAELAKQGRARAATLTWERTAAATRALYDEVLAG